MLDRNFLNLRDLSMESTRDEASSYLNGPFLGKWSFFEKKKTFQKFVKFEGQKERKKYCLKFWGFFA